MAEGGWGGASSGASASPGAGVTYYGNYGNSVVATVAAITTEANAMLVHRGPGATLKNLRVVVATNGRGSASTWTTYKNGASTSQSVSLAATGTYSDLTNTVGLTAGDTCSYALAFGGSSGALFIGGASVNVESSGQAANAWSTLGSVSTTTASATRYYAPAGNLTTAQGTEIAAQAAVPAAGVLSNLRVVATAARATATTVRTRIAGANGNQSVSVTAAGTYEDLANTDTVTAGQLVTIASVTSTGTDTLTLVHLSQVFTPNATRTTGVVAMAASSASLTAGVTRYAMASGLLGFTSSEGGSQIPAPVAGTASYLVCAVSANASTTDVTAVLRLAGVDTTVAVVIPAGSTGVFTDTTHSALVTAGVLASVKFSGATTGGVTVRSLGMAFTADASPVTSVGTVALAADVAGVTGSRGVVALTADVAGVTETSAGITLVADFAPSAVAAATGSILIGATVDGQTATQGVITLEAAVSALAFQSRRFVALL